MDDSEAPRLEANEKSAAAAALACVLKHMQTAEPAVKQPDPEVMITEQQHQQSSARQVDPRVLRSDRMKGASSSHSEHGGCSKSQADDAAQSEAPASRHISAEHVGSTSKWTQVTYNV